MKDETAISVAVLDQRLLTIDACRLTNKNTVLSYDCQMKIVLG